MKRPFAYWTILLFALGGGACSRSGSDTPLAAAAAPPGGTVLRRQTFRDTQSNNMESHTLLVPDGWKAEGGAWWAPPAASNIMPSQSVILTGPDGSQIRVGPSAVFKHVQPSPLGMQYGMRPPPPGSAVDGYIAMPMPANEQAWREWITRHVVLDNFPGAQNIELKEMQEIPEFTRMLAPTITMFRQQAAEMNQMARFSGVMHQSAGGGGGYGFSLRFDFEGKAYEMVWALGLVYYGTEMEVGRETTWVIEPNFSIMAPEGELEERAEFYFGVISTLQPTPAWAEMVRRHQQEMNRIAARGAADRAEINRQASQDVARIQNESWQNRMDSQERGSRQFSHAMLGVSDYSTPDGSTTVLPSTHSHVFTNGHGEYFLSNDPSFDPNANRLLNSNTWTEMRSGR